MKNLICVLAILFGLITGACPCLAQSETSGNTPNTRKTEQVTVTGRLLLDKKSKTETFLVHSLDKNGFFIQGIMAEQLRKILKETGENNIVCINGEKTGTFDIYCEKKNSFETNLNGERVLKSEVKCVRYYELKPTAIVSFKKSDEPVPEPARDTGEERRIAQRSETLVGVKPIVGQMRGIITTLNLGVKTPLKNMVVTNIDKNNPLQKSTILLTNQTRITKYVDKDKLLPLAMSALETGQEITVVYSRDETKIEAITVHIEKTK